jgi:hypothetical protein
LTAFLPATVEYNILDVNISRPQTRVDMVQCFEDIISLLFQASDSNAMWLGAPFRMDLKNFDALNCTIDSIHELQLICLVIITNHCTNPSEDILQAIGSKKNDPEFAIGIVLLGFRHAEIYILDH